MTEAAAQDQRTVPTLKTLSDSQIAAIRSIPAHDSEDAKKPPVLNARRPKSIFLSQERYDLEQRSVFHRLPVPFAATVVLPSPSSVIAIDNYGANVVLTRDKAGVVRAFRNVCTHKGSKIIEEEQPTAMSRMVCPYHAWTFALDGKLTGVPRSETFAGLCKEDRPLTELQCREAGGIIWVGLEPGRDYDFSAIDPQIVADFEAMNLPRMHLYGRKSFDLKANWKLVLEPFLEAYHVRRLHAKSVGPLFADNPSVFHVLGRSIRQVSGKANFTPESLDTDNENVHKTVTHAYVAFPNLVLVTSPYYISLMILTPRAVDRTVVDYMMLTREAPINPKASELFARSYEMILSVFGNEDFHAAQLSQRGLETGGMTDVVYSGMEEMVLVYYDILERELRLTNC